MSASGPFFRFTVGIDLSSGAPMQRRHALFLALAATLVALRAANINARTLLVMIAINVGIGFLPGTAISWQAHLGGIVVGAAVMGVYVSLRGPRRRSVRIAAISGIALVLVVLAASYYLVPPISALTQ